MSPSSPELLKEADNLRFQLGWLLKGATVLGDDMDAPVKLRDDFEGHHHTSMLHFLKRYDEARRAP